jgi:hypothetical protein
MSLVTLTKVTKVTKAQSAIIAKGIASLPAPGNRSGNSPQDREIRLAVATAILTAIVTGESVELTAIVRSVMTGENVSNEYHIAWTRTRTLEKHIGRNMSVTMFTEVTGETAKTITGVTATSRGRGRVFITAL